MITNSGSGTNVHEIADGIYRINTPVPPSEFPGGFSFNQYLVVDEDALLFHTGPRRLFPLVSEAVAAVMPLTQLRHVALSHVEADECGALNAFLAIAPRAAPLCGQVAAMVSIGDLADRAPKGMADGETLSLGRRSVRWLDAPHLPHGWECGYLAESTTGTLFCGDLFTQPGVGADPVTTADILEPSEGFRQAMDYFAHSPASGALIEKLASTAPRTLACMHGSAWTGDGAALLRSLALRLAA
jgi:flavorubredoxin